MWPLALRALLVICGLCSALDARAQAPRTALVLVLESNQGLSGASQLRATLSRQFGVRVVALGEFDLELERPGAMIAVATGPTNAVRVVYVDAHGRRDALSAPAPTRRTDLSNVVQTLVGALLARHLGDLLHGQGELDEDVRDRHAWLDEEARLSAAVFSRSLSAALGRLGSLRHRSGNLEREDF